MRPHRGRRGVLLRYADGSRRFVAHNGVLTVGEATKLLKTHQMAIYRLAERKKLVMRNSEHGFARVRVASMAEFSTRAPS